MQRWGTRPAVVEPQAGGARRSRAAERRPPPERWTPFGPAGRARRVEHGAAELGSGRSEASRRRSRHRGLEPGDVAADGHRTRAGARAAAAGHVGEAAVGDERLGLAVGDDVAGLVAGQVPVDGREAEPAALGGGDARRPTRAGWRRARRRRRPETTPRARHARANRFASALSSAKVRVPCGDRMAGRSGRWAAQKARIVPVRGPPRRRRGGAGGDRRTVGSRSALSISSGADTASAVRRA